jgi:hypothetical protein
MSIALSTPLALSQQSVVVSDYDGTPLPSMLLSRDAFQYEDQTTPLLRTLSAEEWTELRASGIDPSWISQSYALPSFDPNLHRATQEDHPIYVESWATHNSNGRGLRLDDDLRFKVGRTTDLSDGNISGSQGALGGDDQVASITQSEGEYDLYDLSLEWDAIRTGDVEFSVLSGLKAIEANIAKRVKYASGDTQIDSEHRVTLMPMVGSGVRWQISDDLSISGSAITHPIESGDALIDFNAATDLRISRNVGFVAGYRIIRSSFGVGNVDAELTQEGLFARLQISF